ncbi:MAG: hypothetical protein Q4B65_02350, partial [Candidatus Saccharibacteria bacterium]|nr:hypothetical protein [Candidatus Saccharibacteria bacterium]
LPEFPVIAAVISGGHTQILRMPEHDKFEIIGTTMDDAIGECFDKVAKILGLPYPGGPAISKVALSGDAEKYKFPKPKVEGLNFSFSGLKTAVLRAVQKELGLPISHPSHDLKNHLSEQQVFDFAASFQKTAVEIIRDKLVRALEMYPETKAVVVAGGVSANQTLRETLTGEFTGSQGGFSEEAGRKIPVFFPTPALSGDNGAMVAAAAYYEILAGVEPTNPYRLNIAPRTPIK